MQRVFFITGTDTGAGKTVFGALFARYLFERGGSVIAFKPLCSGGREDALALYAALGESISLDTINPWHFRAPLAPVLAARREKCQVSLARVLAHIRKAARQYDTVLVEGAGGLLSPLGNTFSSRDLVIRLRARPLIIAQNKLGVVNHVLLTLAALPQSFRSRAQIIMMSPPRTDLAAATNVGLLREVLPRQPIHTLPWLGKNFSIASVGQRDSIQKVLAAVVGE